MESGSSPRPLKSAAGRFLLAGGFNTAVTTALLAGLAIVIDPRLAYAIVFAAGLALSTYLAHRFVYGVRMTRADVVAYVAMYLVVFALGYVVVSAIERSDLPRWATALVVLVTAPLTFVGGRVITRRSHDRSTRGSAAPVGHTSDPHPH